MSRILIVVFTIFTTMISIASRVVQDPPQEPYPGRDLHQPPPEGWHCEHQWFIQGLPQVEEEKVCKCERRCMEQQDGTTYTVEDPKCLVYCHKDHCDCPTPCEDS